MVHLIQKQRYAVLISLAFGNVEQDIKPADDAALFIAHDRRIAGYQLSLSVRALDSHFLTVKRLASFDSGGHGTFFMRHCRAISVVKPRGDAPSVDRQTGNPPRKIEASPVVMGEPALGIDGQHGRWQFGYHLAKAPFALAEFCLSELSMGDVAGDFGRADDPALIVLDRGHGQGDVDQRSVLAAPHGFKLMNPLAATDAREDFRLFMP